MIWSHGEVTPLQKIFQGNVRKCSCPLAWLPSSQMGGNLSAERPGLGLLLPTQAWEVGKERQDRLESTGLLWRPQNSCLCPLPPIKKQLLKTLSVINST